MANGAELCEVAVLVVPDALCAVANVLVAATATMRAAATKRYFFMPAF
jgi:hypothetical protein